MIRTFGLIGYPLTHSFSRNYFTQKFREEGLDKIYSYHNYELKSLNDFSSVLSENDLLAGLNVTIPHKENIIPYLDELDPVAAEIGAVNTICISRNGDGRVLKTKGFNTDITGFESALHPYLQPNHDGALVLGSGGASKAVIYVLKKLGIPYKIVSRQQIPGSISYEEITRDHIHDFPIIINTTPLGTFPNILEFPPIPYEALDSKNILFDLVYNPEETRFMQLGAARGAVVSNGYKMLCYQAEASWNYWMSVSNPV